MTRLVWFRVLRVNLIKNLFSRHALSEHALDSSYLWPGRSGAKYLFQVHPLGTTFRPVPGIYIYAKRLTDGDWEPIYISQTRDLHQRLEGHVTAADAVENGATHLHAHYCTAGQSARFTEEHDLIQRWQPRCNDPVES